MRLNQITEKLAQKQVPAQTELLSQKQIERAASVIKPYCRGKLTVTQHRITATRCYDGKSNWQHNGSVMDELQKIMEILGLPNEGTPQKGIGYIWHALIDTILRRPWFYWNRPSWPDTDLPSEYALTVIVDLDVVRNALAARAGRNTPIKARTEQAVAALQKYCGSRPRVTDDSIQMSLCSPDVNEAIPEVLALLGVPSRQLVTRQINQRIFWHPKGQRLRTLAVQWPDEREPDKFTIVIKLRAVEELIGKVAYPRETDSPEHVWQ